MSNPNEEFIKSLTYSSANLRLEVNYLIRNFFAYSAPLGYLEKLGRDRNVPRLPNETEGDYRERVEDAWNQNINLGNAESIQLRMDSLGYIFNNYKLNDTTSGEGSYNLVVRSTSDQLYDGTYQYDGTIQYNGVGTNDILIQIVQAAAITQAQNDAIFGALTPILRATARLFISKINP